MTGMRGSAGLARARGRRPASRVGPASTSPATTQQGSRSRRFAGEIGGGFRLCQGCRGASSHARASARDAPPASPKEEEAEVDDLVGARLVRGEGGMPKAQYLVRWQDDYSDNVAGFVRTSFGTVIGGNTADQIRELTRRQRGVGNAFLAFDDFHGQLARWGGAYIGRFGPSRIGVVVDENGDFEVGSVFQRPIGQRDLRFSGRVRQGQFVAADGITGYDTTGVAAVGEIVFGSSVYDLGLGYEKLDGPLGDLDRWFVSSGAQTQLGALRLSGEVHFGETAGQRELAAAIGASYDISRGLSLNLGVNGEEARIVADGVQIIETDQITAIASARYSF